MRVPGIYVEVRGDVSQLESDLRRAKQQVRSAANDMSDAMGNALNPNQITSGIGKIIGRFSELSNYAQVAGKSLSGLQANLGDLQSRTGVAAEQFGQLQSKFLEVQAVKTAERALKDLGSTLDLDAQSVTNLGMQFNLADSSIQKICNSLGQTEKVSVSLARAMKELAAANKQAETSGDALSALDGVQRAAEAQAVVAAEQLAAKTAKAFNEGLAKQKFGSLGESFTKPFGNPTSGFDLGLNAINDQVDTAFKKVGAASWQETTAAAKTAETQLKSIFISLAASEAEASRGMLAFEATVSAAMGGVEARLVQLTQVFNIPKEQIDQLRAKAQQGIEANVKTDLLRQLAKDANLSTSEIKAMEQQLGVTMNRAVDVGGRFKSLGNIIKNTFLYGNAYQMLGWLQQLPGQIIEVQAKMEALRATFTGIFGEDKGAEQFNYVALTANKYGKAIDVVAESYRKFAAAADYVGMSAQGTRAIFESVTQAITKVGGSSNDVQGTLLALQQMISKGTVSAEEFRLQFAERVPGAMKMGADALGVTTAQFKKLLEQGGIVATDFIPKLAAQLDKFSQGWEASSDTIEANSARLKNAIFTSFDSPGLQHILNSTLKKLTDFATNVGVVLDAIGNRSKVGDLISAGVTTDKEVREKGNDWTKNLLAEYDAAAKTLEGKIDYFQRAKARVEEAANARPSGQKALDSFSEFFRGSRSENIDSALSPLLDEKAKKDEIEKLSKALDTLVEKSRVAGQDGKQGLLVINQEILDMATELEKLTGKPWNIFAKITVERSALDSAIAAIQAVYDKTAIGKADGAEKAFEDLKKKAEDARRGLASAQATIADPNSDNREIRAAKENTAKATEALRQFEVSAADEKEKIRAANKAAQLATLRNTDQYAHYKPSDFSDLPSKALVRQAAYKHDLIETDYWAKIYSPNQSDIDMARKLQAEAYAKYQKGVKDDQDAAKKKALAGAKRELRVEALEDTADGYVAKQFGLANNDPLGTKFAEIETKAKAMVNRSKELALQTGMSVEDFSAKVKQGTEDAKAFAAKTAVEQLFPYLKKDEAIKTFWTEVKKHPEEMAKAAEALGTSLGALEAKVSGLLQYKADLNSLKVAMDYSGDFSEYSKAYDLYSKKTYENSGDAERKVWADLKAMYQSTSDDMLETRKSMYSRVADLAKAAGLDEGKAARFAAVETDKLAKDYLTTRLSYEDSFTAYLSDTLSLQYGLYKSQYGKILDAWKNVSDAIVKAVEGVENSISSVLATVITDGLSGKFKTLKTYTQSLLDGIKQTFATFISDMAKIALKRYIIVPILGQIVGTDGSFGASSSTSSASGSSSSGLNLSSLLKGAGTVKDGYNLYSSLSGGSSLYESGTLTTAGAEYYDAMVGAAKEAGTYTDLFAEQTWDKAMGMSEIGPSSASASGLLSTSVGSSGATIGSMGTAGLAGGAAGYTVGQMLRPDNPSSSYAGAAVGTGAGLLASYYGAGMWAGPIGIAAATIAAAVTAAVTPATVSTTWSEMPGSQPAIAVTNGQLTPMSFGVTKQTTSGMASSSTSHAIWFQAANEALSAEEQAKWKTATAGLVSFSKAMGYTSDELNTLSEGYSHSPLDAKNIDAYGILSNELSTYTTQQMGLYNELASVQNSGESLTATMARLASTMTSMDAISRATGFDFSGLTKGLSKIQAANYVSDLAETVGSISAVQTALGLLTSHTKTNAELLQAQIEQTTKQVGPDLAALGTNLSSFWTDMQTAMSNGPIDPTVFSQWGDAATLMDSLGTLSTNLTEVQNKATQTAAAARQFSLALDSRALSAQGLDYQASLVTLLAQQESELTQARLDGYDAATLARIAEVQTLETAAVMQKHAEEYASALQSAGSRLAAALGDTSAKVASQIVANAQEMADLEKKFNHSPGSADENLFITLARAQTAELVATIKDLAQATAKATASMRSDLDAREATVAGYGEEASAIQKVTGFTNELTQAYSDSLDASLVNELMKTQLDELAKYWSDTISGMKTKLNDLYATQASLLSTLKGNTQTAIENLYKLFTRYQAGETGLADSIVSSLQSIASAVSSMVESINSTLAQIRTGSDYSTSTADVNASTAKSYFDEQYTKAAGGDTTAMSNVTNYATSYLTALKSSTADAGKYQSGVDHVTSMLSQLASGASSTTSGITGIATQVTNAQIAEAQAALKHAEVAQLKTKYDTLYAQVLAAFESSDAGTYTSAMAATGAGWGAVADVFNTYAPYSQSQLERLRNGSLSWGNYVGYFLNSYGTGSGYVNWDGALALWAGKNALPGVMSALWTRTQAAYGDWQNLKTQYGFTSGGVIGGGTDSGDTTLSFTNKKERILTERQNRAFEALAYGADQGGLVAKLIAKVEKLTARVEKLQQANTEENRGVVRQLLNLNRRMDSWEVTGLPPERKVSA